MAVFRIEKTRDYTVMSNHHLRNTALSLKAKGLLSLMLSLPEGWDYTTKGLARICKDGVDSICAGVRELEEQGYVIRERVRNANGQLGAGETLETIYQDLNRDRPDNFHGHSLSVSDVVVLREYGEETAYYCDRSDFVRVPEFLQEQQRELAPDALETGETVRTPRGTFYVTDMSREQMEAAGYGFHHQSEDGNYLIMGNGSRAFAIRNGEAQEHAAPEKMTVLVVEPRKSPM